MCKGSRALGSHGAALLNEVTHRTLEASTLPELEEAQAAQPPAAAAALRPQPRPAGPAAGGGAPETRKKRGLRQRIAGLFH